MSGTPTAKHPTEVLAVLLLAGVTFALSQTLVIPALTVLGRDLDASPAATSWILTAFLLSASIATPIAGKLGDLYGKGRVLTGVLLLFSAGAVFNALAGSIEVLIAGRTLQGVAGGVFPLAFGIVRDTFPPQRIPAGLSLISAVFGIGGGIGLPLSGVIVDNLDTAWLFWIGLIALPAALAAHRLIPPSPPVERARVDWLGAALLSASLAALLLGVTKGPEWGWGSVANVSLLAGGLALAFGFVRAEARLEQPLIDLRVLGDRAVAATNLTSFVVGMGMFAGFLLIPQLAQTPPSAGYGLGASATTAGLLLLPTALAQLVAGPVAGHLGPRVGFRAVLAAGTLLMSASFFLLAAAHGHAWDLIITGTLLGVGISAGFAAMANLVVAAVPQSEVGIATGINTVMRTVGGSFGSAIAAAILAGSLMANGVPSEGAYTGAFAFAGTAGLLAFVAALLVPRAPRATAATPVAESA